MSLEVEMRRCERGIKADAY